MPAVCACQAHTNEAGHWHESHQSYLTQMIWAGSRGPIYDMDRESGKASQPKGRTVAPPQVCVECMGHIMPACFNETRQTCPASAHALRACCSHVYCGYQHMCTTDTSTCVPRVPSHVYTTTWSQECAPRTFLAHHCQCGYSMLISDEQPNRVDAHIDKHSSHRHTRPATVILLTQTCKRHTSATGMDSQSPTE